MSSEELMELKKSIQVEKVQVSCSVTIIILLLKL